MNKYSKNNKLNSVLTAIEEDLNIFGLDEVKRYAHEFKNEPDYNIAQYGNLLVYYSDIFGFYRSHGYKTTEKMSNEAIWGLYKRQIGYVVRFNGWV